MPKRCGADLGKEAFGDYDPPRWQRVECLLNEGHDGPHADWTAWIGVARPDFSRPGGSLDASVRLPARHNGSGVR